MLRYNNQASVNKHVDYYRPLTVDVSVEYELPKEVSPPKGSAPLLIIHPSAYFRSKNQPQPQLPNPSNYHGQSLGKSRGQSPATSSMYYGSPVEPNRQQAPQQQQHISKSLRSNSSSARSRSVIMANESTSRGSGVSMNCPYGSCDECPSCISRRDKTSNILRKAQAPPPQHYQPLPFDRLSQTSKGTMNNNNQNATASNKRLRMMNQQQSIIMQNNSSSAQQPMEPLNLAITPSSYQNNQFSNFLGLNVQGNGNSQMSFSPSPAPPLPLGGIGSGSHYGFPTSTSTSFYSAQAQQSGRFASMASSALKDCPVPVNKGSGSSDSGVCSENDSDVSPTTAGSSFSSTHPRRSIFAQELPTSGCYCCCCPTSPSTSYSKKSSSTSSHSSLKSGSSSSKGKPITNTSRSQQSTLSTSELTYGSLMTALVQQQLQQSSRETGTFGSFGSPDVVGSAMGIDYQQRKWLGTNPNSGLVMDSTTTSVAAAAAMNPATLGRWFQV